MWIGLSGIRREAEETERRENRVRGVLVFSTRRVGTELQLSDDRRRRRAIRRWELRARLVRAMKSRAKLAHGKVWIGAVRCYAVERHGRRRSASRRCCRIRDRVRRDSCRHLRSQSDGRPNRAYSPSRPRVPCPERCRCRSSLARNSRRARRRRAHSRNSHTRSLVEGRRCQSQVALEPPAQEPGRRAVLLKQIVF